VVPDIAAGRLLAMFEGGWLALSVREIRSAPALFELHLAGLSSKRRIVKMASEELPSGYYEVRRRAYRERLPGGLGGAGRTSAMGPE